MAVQRTAAVTAVYPAGKRGRRLCLELAGDRLGFAGGQYVIVDTGLPKGDGKTVKRAYSVLSPDRDQGRFELAVRVVPGGAGSPHMIGIDAGAEVRFSGPWGKWQAIDDDGDGDVLVVATDTGITAALGLIAGDAFAGRLARTTLVWCTPSPGYFLDPAWVRERAGCEVAVAAMPPVGNPDRVPAAARAVLVGREAPRQAYLVGDGDVIAELADRLVAAGTEPAQIRTEFFFHKPRPAS